MKEDLIAYRRGLVDSGGKAVKKKDYRLSFNLSTELGKDTCERNNRSSESLREKTDKYNL